MTAATIIIAIMAAGDIGGAIMVVAVGVGIIVVDDWNDVFMVLLFNRFLMFMLKFPSNVPYYAHYVAH